MILDGHMHIRDSTENREVFLRRLGEAGIDGGIVISLPPPAFFGVAYSSPPLERVDNVLFWCDPLENLYPFYWIDPLEDSAADQVAMAIDKGVMGFKVICDRHYPGDKKAMEIFRAIAESNRPILFHSGVLGDRKPSARYNRPSEFEVLLMVKGLRFSLAHISWPWCDELIAVYGKFLHACTRDPGWGDRELYSSVEMFIDMSPGTPPIYRRDALTKLFTVGYDVENNMIYGSGFFDVENNIIFGSDCFVNEYDVEWAQQWIRRDNKIFQGLGLGKNVLDKIYAENLKRFVGLSSVRIDKKPLKPGE